MLIGTPKNLGGNCWPLLGPWWPFWTFHGVHCYRLCGFEGGKPVLHTPLGWYITCIIKFTGFNGKVYFFYSTIANFAQVFLFVTLNMLLTKPVLNTQRVQ